MAQDGYEIVIEFEKGDRFSTLIAFSSNADSTLDRRERKGTRRKRGISRNGESALGNFRAGDDVPPGSQYLFRREKFDREAGVGWNAESSRGNFELETGALARLHAPSCHVIMRELSYRVRDSGRDSGRPPSRGKKKGGCGETSRKRSGSLKSRSFSDHPSLRQQQSSRPGEFNSKILPPGNGRDRPSSSSIFERGSSKEYLLPFSSRDRVTLDSSFSSLIRRRLRKLQRTKSRVILM